MLEAVGLRESEERIYRFVLGRPGISLHELVAVSGQKRRDVEETVASLEAQGLVSRIPDEEIRLTAAPPDIAIEGLIQRRQAQLAEARLHAAQLTQEFRHAQEEASVVELIELVRGREAVHQRSLQVQRSATKEVMGLSKPPYAAPSVINETEREVLARGVTYRTIYNRDALEIPHLLEELEVDMEAGEQSRVLAELPMKLLIADRRVGLVPLNITEQQIDSALIVHSSWLLEAMVIVFESCWNRAVPLRSLRRGDGTLGAEDAGSPPAQDLRLLELVAAGLTDGAVASQMRIGVRTLHRRMNRLMKMLGAETRFQAGFQAAKQGWL